MPLALSSLPEPMHLLDLWVPLALLGIIVLTAIAFARL